MHYKFVTTSFTGKNKLLYIHRNPLQTLQLQAINSSQPSQTCLWIKLSNSVSGLSPSTRHRYILCSAPHRSAATPNVATSTTLPHSPATVSRSCGEGAAGGVRRQHWRGRKEGDGRLRSQSPAYRAGRAADNRGPGPPPHEC